jgi:hypothetical protein
LSSASVLALASSRSRSSSWGNNVFGISSLFSSSRLGTSSLRGEGNLEVGSSAISSGTLGVSSVLLGNTVLRRMGSKERGGTSAGRPARVALIGEDMVCSVSTEEGECWLIRPVLGHNKSRRGLNIKAGSC